MPHGKSRHQILEEQRRKPKAEQRKHWNKAVASVWRQARVDADLSQAELAKALGWGRDTVADIEAGRRKVELTDVILLATVVKLDPKKLFERILLW